MRVPGTDGRADKRFALLGRYSSEIRTGCANERSSGSVRGAPGNWCPYRDQHLSIEGVRSDGFLQFESRETWANRAELRSAWAGEGARPHASIA